MSTNMLDVMIGTVVVGLAIPAAMNALGSGSQIAEETANIATAVNLARSAHEYAMTLPLSRPSSLISRVSPPYCASLDDLNGWVSSSNNGSVIDSFGNTMSGFSRWEQSIAIYGIDPATPAVNQATVVRTQPRRLVITVRYNGQVIHTQPWILAPTLNRF